MVVSTTNKNGEIHSCFSFSNQIILRETSQAFYLGTLKHLIMKILDGDLAQSGNIIESILVKSYEDYRKMGGNRSYLDAYHELMSRAERLENKSLELMDMSLSFDIDSAEIHAVANAAQAMYALIYLWFKVPLHKVTYANYILPCDEKESL